ncbi:hypothetical protein ACTXG6_43145 [Pseudonocardia sp. Cha107L01]|jgi:hypothetical protein|uniref:hypothetical protein n=1 Tax=Pseudonocardia sp. Cha107L01 TaxID=3457576 RepID=UPI00403EB13D
MTLRRMTRTLLGKWHLTIPGVLLSLVISGLIFNVVPPLYASSGVAVMVQAGHTSARTSNPLLSFDPSLGTTAQITIASLNNPDTLSEVSVAAGSTFSVKNAGPETTGVLGAQPFIYFNTQSPIAGESAAMVYRLMDVARQNLTDRQKDLKVRAKNYISLQTVVEATPPKYVVNTQAAAAGAALLGGVLVTCGLILLWEHVLSSRRRVKSVSDPVGNSARERVASWEEAERLNIGSREASLKIPAELLAMNSTNIKSNSG